MIPIIIFVMMGKSSAKIDSVNFAHIDDKIIHIQFLFDVIGCYTIELCLRAMMW